MKHEFKPGDKARIVGNITRHGVPIGTEVILDHWTGAVWTFRHSSSVWAAYPDDLEPIDPPQFQAGDTVYDPVLFPGPDPEVPYPGKVVDVQNGFYSVVVKFGIKKVLYTADSRYLDSFQPTLSKTFYRFVREEIKWVPKRGEAVLVGVHGGTWTAGVSDGQGKAWVGPVFGCTWPFCIPFDPDKVGKAVNP